jgi:nucleotide-binding universal stress UspA family protein
VAAEPSHHEDAAGRVVFGYEGSAAAERAIRMMAPVLSVKRALVVTVHEVGLGYELVPPTISPAPEIRAVLERDEAMYEHARRTAEHGAEIARTLGVDAEGLAVADVLSPAETLVWIAREQNAPMVVVGSHSGEREFLVGSTTRAVIRKAPCPVGVVRESAEPQAADR